MLSTPFSVMRVSLREPAKAPGRMVFRLAGAVKLPMVYLAKTRVVRASSV